MPSLWVLRSRTTLLLGTPLRQNMHKQCVIHGPTIWYHFRTCKWSQSRETLKKHTYRVIVSQWYKIKWLTCHRIWHFQVITSILMKWVLRHLIIMHYFATQSNSLLIISYFPSSPIRYLLQTHRPFSLTEAKWIVLKYEEVKLAQGIRGVIWKGLTILVLPARQFAWHSNNYFSDSRTLASWNLSNRLGEGSRKRGTDRHDRRGLQGASWCSPERNVETAERSFKPSQAQCCCFDASLTRASGCIVKNPLTLSICSWGLGFLPFGCSGFRKPVFLNCSSR